MSKNNQVFIAAYIPNLHSSPTNPRKTFDADKLAELTESVRQVGILQPILVRAWPDGQAWQGEAAPLYEVVAGERRYRAAKAAGLDIIPAILRELTTREVLEIQTIENLQRDDLHPLEEAEGYQLMIEAHGYTAESLAEKIGRSRAYVFGRLKLLQLDEESRRLFREGALNPSTALLVARIPTSSLRAQALKTITQRDHNGETLSVRAAQRLLRSEYMVDLKRADFPLDDPTLPGGPCKNCEKRSGNQPVDLFDDIKNKNVCTDPDCHETKKKAWKTRQIDEAKANGKTVITGKQAEKIRYSRDDYTLLDSTCHEDPKKRTYREILGVLVEPVLVENSTYDRLDEYVPNAVLADKLEAAGVEKDDSFQKKRAKIDARIEDEKSARKRIFLAILENIAQWADKREADELQTALLREILLTSRYGNEAYRIGFHHFGVFGKNHTDRMKRYQDAVAGGTAAYCWRWLAYHLYFPELYLNEYTLDRAPEKLHAMARQLGLDPEGIRAGVAAERAKTQKPGAAKRTKKTAARTMFEESLA